MAGGLQHFAEAVELAAKLRDGFASVADVVGPERAFYVFAGQVCQAGLDTETEEKFVAIVRAAFDEYVAAKQPGRT